MRAAAALLACGLTAGTRADDCRGGQLSTGASVGSNPWQQYVTITPPLAAAPADLTLEIVGSVHRGKSAPGPCCGNTFQLTAATPSASGFDYEVRRTDRDGGWKQELLLAWKAGGGACPMPGPSPPGPPAPLPPLPPQNCPLDLGLAAVFICSPSKWAPIKGAARLLGNSFNIGDGAQQARVAAVEDIPAHELDLTGDKAAFDAWVDALDTKRSGISMGRAMEWTVGQLSASAGRRKRAIIMITDANPKHDDSANKDHGVAAAQAFRASGGDIFFICNAENSKIIDKWCHPYATSIGCPPGGPNYIADMTDFSQVIPKIAGIVSASCATPAPAPPVPPPATLPPPPPPVTPVPATPPPITSEPCIRFGHAFPSEEQVDCVVTQTDPAGTGRTHRFSGFGFAQFSNWTNAFVVGKGKVQIYSGGELVVEVADIPLTPGPLVVALKCPAGGPCAWPPASPELGANIETIAASFVPIESGAAVRLFNLAPGVADSVTLSAGGAALVSGVPFSLGSDWVTASAAKATYSVAAAPGGAPLATVDYTPDAAPRGLGVFTQWLLGAKGLAAPYGVQLAPYADAPEQGRCDGW